MNLDRLDKWVSVATNIGVLIGIVLLIFELNQNTALMRAEISSMRAIAKTDRQMYLANSGDIARIAQTAFSNGFPNKPDALTALTPEERFRYGIFLIGLKEALTNWHYQCQEDLLDQEYCRTTFRNDVANALPIFKGMNISLAGSSQRFIEDVRAYATEAGLPVPNEDGTW